MAEFQEVMRQAERMCKAHDECECCPIKEEMDDLGEKCPFCGALDVAAVEQKIMGWVAENPEPRYPTWQEWWQTTFPELVDRHISVNPCAFGVRSKGCNTTGSCHICRTQHIPADIAEKLGVKPIGGRDDG